LRHRRSTACGHRLPSGSPASPYGHPFVTR
jgi:hypothetical protein